MNKNEACEMAQRLLRQYGQSEFQVPVKTAEDLALLDDALKSLSCRTAREGESLVLKVYPTG